MATYPTTPRSDFLTWCQMHDPIFTDHAAAIGLSVEEASAFNAATTTATTQLLAHEDNKDKAKRSTELTQVVFDTLSRSAGSAVRTIRAFAETSADPTAVYQLAQIPSPADHTPMPPPGQPSNLTILLDPTAGTITLRWKCENPDGAAGTSYIIRRRLPDQTEFAFIGVSGKKRFVDDSLVAGPDTVEYTVQGQRGDLAGPLSPIYTVNFGKLANGNRTATVSTAGNVPAVLNVELPAPTGNGRSLVTSR